MHQASLCSSIGSALDRCRRKLLASGATYYGPWMTCRIAHSSITNSSSTSTPGFWSTTTERQVARMYVVGLHPGEATFVHVVPELLDEASRLMEFQRLRAAAAAAAATTTTTTTAAAAAAATAADALDVEGGSSQASQPPLPAANASQLGDLDGALPRGEEEIRECKKRPLLPGAATTAQNFASSFQKLRLAAAERVKNIRSRASKKSFSVLTECETVLASIQNPAWPEPLVRLEPCRSGAKLVLCSPKRCVREQSCIHRSKNFVR